MPSAPPKRARSLALLLALAATAAGAQEPLSIKGLRIGMTEAEVNATLPGMKCQVADNKAIGDRLCYQPRTTLAEVPATVLVMFYDDKLATAHFRVDAGRSKDLLPALRERFGAPEPVSGSRSIARWTTPNGERVDISLSDNGKLIVVALQSEASVAEFQKRNNDERARRAKDL